ncbi:MAG: vitamin K epoxide reductase family protein [Aeromicrobium sp.]|uniref:vitamin K epoxide reductase family protein n=1 Tax=Aeromicrobium sp. TaxID=1871063 RepID=UPI0039E610EF
MSQTDTIATNDEGLLSGLRGFGVFMTVTGAVALVASIVLTVEKIHLLENPDGTLSCDLSAFVSCGGVVNQWQASVFGPPNTLIGIVGFSVVVTVGVLLASGSPLPRWWWGGLAAGVTFGVGFVTWLQSQSIYVIGRLCPYCMIVWTMMIPLFVVTMGQVLREYRPDAALTRVVNEWRVLIVALWLIVVVSLIWFKFGETLWA